MLRATANSEKIIVSQIFILWRRLRFANFRCANLLKSRNTIRYGEEMCGTAKAPRRQGRWEVKGELVDVR
jgi:hypothetical protein